MATLLALTVGFTVATAPPAAAFYWHTPCGEWGFGIPVPGRYQANGDIRVNGITYGRYALGIDVWSWIYAGPTVMVRDTRADGHPPYVFLRIWRDNGTYLQTERYVSYQSAAGGWECYIDDTFNPGPGRNFTRAEVWGSIANASWVPNALLTTIWFRDDR